MQLENLEFLMGNSANENNRTYNGRTYSTRFFRTIARQYNKSIFDTSHPKRRDISRFISKFLGNKTDPLPLTAIINQVEFNRTGFTKVYSGKTTIERNALSGSGTTLESLRKTLKLSYSDDAALQLGIRKETVMDKQLKYMRYLDDLSSNDQTSLYAEFLRITKRMVSPYQIFIH